MTVQFLGCGGCPASAGKRLFHSETANPTADGIAYTAESALVASHFLDFSGQRLAACNLPVLGKCHFGARISQ